MTVLLDQLSEAPPGDARALRRLKGRVAAQTGGPLVPHDALLGRFRRDVSRGLRRADARIERLLTLNQIRSQSGLATVTVVTEPYACPGRCVYCPTEARAPKSYLTNEPAVMRALRNDYDPYRQVWARLSTLRDTGHPTDKVELIVKGGTWSFYPEAYQQLFIQRCVQAANDFPDASNGHAPEARATASALTLEDVQRDNETAKTRVIGVTVETRPDYVDGEEIRRLRALGVTRVELGVQTLEEAVLELIVRDHGVAEVRRATALLKTAGFKVAYHIMPNLPGADPSSDLRMFRRLFDEPAFRPDALKLYPCVVVQTAELSQWWLEGRYAPYEDETLLDLLIAMKRSTPPWVRIERVIRDIPATSILAGCRVTNLREAAQRRMRARGWRCRCIRCRQVRGSAPARCTLRRTTYEASEGTEVFLSFEDPRTDRLASLLRLRSPAPAGATMPCPVPSLQGAALIRELHTYGQHVPLRGRDRRAAQHRGFGARLVREAERIAREEFRADRLAVIAGVGVREYYRRLGYDLQETYMVKPLRVSRRRGGLPHRHTPRWPAGRSCVGRGAPSSRACCRDASAGRSSAAQGPGGCS